MKRCRHDAWQWLRWNDGEWIAVAKVFGPFGGIAAQDRHACIRCLKCRDYIPLGEANDAGPHAAYIAVEMRAAEIADNWREQSYRPGCDRFEWCPQNKSDELCDLCQAHVLAHDIAEHTEES